MLVLTRKTDEQIVIGDDIRITLVRVRGNSVRIGIDAPRDVRVVRGELERFDTEPGVEDQFELSDREQAFAHPPSKVVQTRKQDTNRDHSGGPSDRSGQTEPSTESRIFVGRIRRVEDGLTRNRAPLARFISSN